MYMRNIHSNFMIKVVAIESERVNRQIDWIPSITKLNLHLFKLGPDNTIGRWSKMNTKIV